jgi:hypothetical protein
MLLPEPLRGEQFGMLSQHIRMVQIHFRILLASQNFIVRFLLLAEGFFRWKPEGRLAQLRFGQLMPIERNILICFFPPDATFQT